MKRIAAAMLLLVGLVVLLSVGACSPSGVAQSDVDALKQQASAQEQKANALQQQLSANQAELAKAQQAAAAKDKELADLKAKGGAGFDGTVLVGARQMPAPTPRPTATPLPAGAVAPTAPPPPQPPAAFSQPLALYIHADTITSSAGESQFNVDASAVSAKASCVQTSVFKRGMHLVWRIEVVDIATGKRMTDKEMDKMVVKLPSGDELKARFGRHGATEDSPWFWTAAWDIPLNTPIGTLDWSIQATGKDGKNGTYKPWLVSAPERNVEARTQIID